MSNLKNTLQVVNWIVHGLVAVAVVLLYFKTGGMTVFCVVPAVLIGCASVPAQPGRPITVYAAFGFLMGFAFWDAASMVNQRLFLALIIGLLIGGGAVWFLRAPSWPAALFAGSAILFHLGLAGAHYRWHRLDPDLDIDNLRRSVQTTFVILTIGLTYLVLGFAEASLQETPKRQRRKVRRIEEDE